MEPWPSSISLSKEYPGLISFVIDWFDLDDQGTLKSLLQHCSLKTSILRHSALFMVQLSYPYMINGNTMDLTIWTYVSKVISLLFNTLFRFVIAFLPRCNRFLISWLQSLSSVILEPKKRKSITASTFSPSMCQEVMEPDDMIIVFFFFFSFSFLKILLFIFWREITLQYCIGFAIH